MNDTERRIVALIQAEEDRYRAELRGMPESAKTAKNHWYAHAVNKASMCQVIRLRIERGDHLPSVAGDESCA